MTREIHIEPVLNGYVCQIGCQWVVFESSTKMLVEIGRYLQQPDSVEAEYLKNAVNPMGVPVPLVPQCSPVCNTASEPMAERPLR
jgi:hypothetical protein